MAVATASAARPQLLQALDDRPLAMLWMGVLLFSTGPVMVAASSTPGGVLSFWRPWVGAALLGGLVLWRRRAGRVTSLQGWRWSAVAGLAFGTHQHRPSERTWAKRLTL